MDGGPFFVVVGEIEISLYFQYSLSKDLFPLKPMLPLPLLPLSPILPCTNAVPLDCVVLCTIVLLYFLRRGRVYRRFFGYRLSPVVK